MDIGYKMSKAEAKRERRRVKQILLEEKLSKTEDTLIELRKQLELEKKKLLEERMKLQLGDGDRNMYIAIDKNGYLYIPKLQKENKERKSVYCEENQLNTSYSSTVDEECMSKSEHQGMKKSGGKGNLIQQHLKDVEMRTSNELCRVHEEIDNLKKVATELQISSVEDKKLYDTYRNEGFRRESTYFDHFDFEFL